MPQELTLRDIVYPLIIIIVSGIATWMAYWRLGILLLRLADKTKTTLDNLIVEAIKWPICVGIILAGIYFATMSLPFVDPLDSVVGQGFNVAFLMLAGWAGTKLLDSVYIYYKLEIASKTKTSLDDWIIGLLRIFSPLLAVFLVVVYSLRILDIDTTLITDWMALHGNRIGLIILISFALIFIIGKALPAMIRGIVYRRAFGQPDTEIVKRADTLSNVFVTTVQVLIIAIAVLMILSQLGIDIVPILTGVGVAGIAVGFGAQTLVKDYLAGIFVIMENQYRVGDVVKIAGIIGLVENIDLRRTVLRDLDGVQHVVSNGEIRVASNFTKEVSRVNLNISVSYGTDLDHAINVINRVCQEIAEDPEWAHLILKTPQVLRVDNLGDSGIDLKILGETQPIQQWNVMGEIRKRIKKTFDEEGIEIPWPHIKVYFGDSSWKNEHQGSSGEAKPKKSKGQPPVVPDRNLETLPPESPDND